MNVPSDNKYLRSRVFDIKSYSLNDFLYKELAVEKRFGFNDVMLAFGGLLTMCGFDIHMRGTHYLAELAAARSVDAEYSQDVAIERISRNNDTNSVYVKAEIASAVRCNSRFCGVTSAMLGETIYDNAKLELAEVVEIVSAAFKIYYNYVTDDTVM